MATYIMHDQEMMDFLEERYVNPDTDEPADAVTFYGNLFTSLENPGMGLPNENTRKEYVEKMNNLMAELGTPFNAVELISADDDGYTWKWEEIKTRF